MMNNSSKSQPLLTETELANLLRVSKKLLQKMRREGSGPRYVKIGRSVRYKIQDVENYLDVASFSFTAQEKGNG